MKKSIIIWIVIIIVVIGIIITVRYKKQPEEVIKIGAILPLTGKAASLGVDMQNAINLAIEKVNSKEKIVEVIYEDEQCEPKEAVTAYRSLILKGVKIIIGAACSSSTLAIAPLAEQEKVILITASSGVDTIRQAGDFIFRNHVFTSQKESKLAEFASQHFSTVATIYDQTNDGYVLGEQFFTDKFQGNILVRESYQKDATDFRTQLTKIKATNPEAVFIGGLMPETALIVKQMEELDISARIITEDAVATDNKFLDTIGSLSEGIIFSGSEFSRETNPDFWDLYTERFGKNPNIFAAQAFDCLMILASIIQEKCSSGDSICVKGELYKVQDYAGVSGLTSFDENGDALKPILIKTIKNGQFVPLENESF